MTDVLKLIARAINIDQYGREVYTETEKEVYCEVDSITRNEFYAAENTELNPECKFVVFFGDYEGESIVEYNGNRYSVYRTFRTSDYMELYCERKVGV